MAPASPDAVIVPTLPLDTGRLLSAVVIVAALPAPLIVLMLTGSGRLLLLACAVLPLVMLVVGPRLWPEWGRFGGLILVGPAVVTSVTGVFVLFVVLFSFCPTDGDRSYLSTIGDVLAVCGFAVPYALGSLWAVARPSRVLWAWPLAILAAAGIGIAVLALLEGGPHHCYT